MLEIKNLSKTFLKGTPNEHKALDGISLSLDKGEFVTVIGSNGAGKSTLFNAIAGEFLCDGGKIVLDGKNITYQKEYIRAKDIGRLFQDPMRGTAPDLTIEENLALVYSKATRHLFSPALKKRDVEFFREKLLKLNMGLEDRLKTLEGYTSVDIAKKFHQEKIKTPVEYLIERGATHRKPVGRNFSWQHTTICAILKNHFYVGDMVYGKYKKDTVGGKNHLKPRSEWKITYHHHESIIEREIFEAVQQTRGTAKPYQPRKAHSLMGKLVCGECGKALRYRKVKNPYFYCNERYTTGNEKCVIQVNVFFLEQVLLSALQKEIHRQMDLEEMWSQYQEVQKGKYPVKLEQLQKTKKGLDAVGKEQITLYERYGKREISKEEYIELREKLQKKEDSIKSEIQKQEMRLAGTEIHADLPDAHILWKECKINELNQEAVDTFIKKVKVWNEQHMEIIWNFSNRKE